MPKNKLTPKQKKFCEEYVIDLNGTQAAIRAGYSRKTANEQSSQNLAKLNIQSFISELQKKLSEKTGITAERVINELAKIGFSNIQDYINGNNSVLELKTIEKDKAASVESIKTIVTEWDGGTKTSVSFKLYDKVSALEKLGRHLGIFEADNRQQQKTIKVSVANE